MICVNKHLLGDLLGWVKKLNDAKSKDNDETPFTCVKHNSGITRFNRVRHYIYPSREIMGPLVFMRVEHNLDLSRFEFVKHYISPLCS